jgi:hypothetical protein
VSDIGDRDEAQLSEELGTLDPNARYVVAALAVLGRPASLQALGEVSGVPDPRPAVTELERRRLITREPGELVSVPDPVQGRLMRLLPTEAAHARRQLDRLAAMGAPTEVMRTSTETVSAPPDRRGTNWPLAVLAGVALAAAGVGLGYLIADQTSEATTVTESSPAETQTVTGTGSTTTVEVTTTATETSTVTETATVTETVTVPG